VHIPSGAGGRFAAFLAGTIRGGKIGAVVGAGDAGQGAPATANAFREQVRGVAEPDHHFGSEIHGDAIASLVKFGAGILAAKLICLGDYANSRRVMVSGLRPRSWCLNHR